MATLGGPNIAVDGLVFGYDTGYPLVSASHESYKFNKGEPTTNVLNDTILGVGNGASLGSDDFGKYIQLANQTTSYSRFQLPNITVSSDETYTWSFELYSEDTINQSGNTYYFDTNEYSDQFPSSNDQSRLSSSQDRPNTITTGEWTPFRLTVTMKPNLTGAYTYDFFNMTYPTFQNKKIYYRNMQFERNKDHKTPYVGQGGIRSVTESLIDLKRTTDIDLSNVSFDSNAQILFDGSDDQIDLGTGILSLQNNSFTLEVILKWDGSTTQTFLGYREPSHSNSKSIHWRIYDSGMLRFDFYGSSINSSAGAIETGNWYHLSLTYDLSTDTCKCYRNGTLLMQGSTGPYNGSDAASNFYIGSWGNLQYFNGKVPIVKAYNKALSAEEVQQNFQAYKNRFNL